MRVSSGLYKGKEILVPKNGGVIPTTDKTRQALMNMLHSELSGAHFLDLYAGSGAVGIEALSNGAAFACFVESGKRVYPALKENLERIVEPPAQYMTVKHNCAQLTPEMVNNEQFDIVFADPFYEDAPLHAESLFAFVWQVLKPGGIFILEHASRDHFDRFPHFVSRKDYGDTALSVYRLETL